jgi:ABC-type antimicrobial peptide transport system permease subunit
MALGASSTQLVWLFVRRMIVPLALGVSAGLSGALGLGQFIRRMLIQTSPYDPVTLLSITILLIAIALTAAFLPARRATRLDPAVALRDE